MSGRDRRPPRDRTRASRDRRPPSRSRTRVRNDRPRSASGGRTLLWLVLFLAIAGLLLVGVGRSVIDGGDDGEATPTVSADAAPVIRVTFPEGIRREEMAEIVGRDTTLSAEEYLEATAPGARGRQLAGTDDERSLEGFLFPATYDVYADTTVQDLVDQQVDAYRDRTAAVDFRYARSRNLTRYEVLIIASMVEREVRVPAERPIVAGVIYNRLRAGMRLDIDATVQYALGEWKTELTASDLDIDSPYNTRKFMGLPPGPIANPGSASIVAAARPQRHDYLYYVARADGSGRHYFARSAAEFEEAVARARANAG